MVKNSPRRVNCTMLMLFPFLWASLASVAQAGGSSGLEWGLRTSVLDVGDPSDTKMHRTLARRLDEVGADVPVKTWVFFTDKGINWQEDYDAAIHKVAATCNPRTLYRRALRRTRPGLFDLQDIPVSQRYIDAVEATGAGRHVSSRWLNGISVWATGVQLEEIERLSFVRALDVVRTGKRAEPRDVAASSLERQTSQLGVRDGFYGEAEAQLDEISLIALHDLGFTGNGTVIGVLDSGFHLVHGAFNYPSHSVNVIAEYDFVNGDDNTDIELGDPGGQTNHGTMILSIMGGYLPDEYVGAAYDASFILCKTEDDSSETPIEEDNYVAGLEFIEANGGDLATSSLAYWFVPPWQMDGRTTVASMGVNVATANGLICLNCAGNSGHDDDPNTLTLGTPADAFQAIGVGAVTSTGAMADFSSDGPSADGRVKPEVLARGVNTRVVDPNGGGYFGVSGTSAATPLVAGAVACLLQAHPTWTVDQMRTYLFNTADYYVANQTFEPTYLRGYGIIDALAAHGGDCNGNGVEDADDITGGTSTDCDGNGVPDECFMRDCNDNDVADPCDIADGPSLDENANGIPDECECTPLAAPLPSPYPAAKSRYLSFASGNPGKRTAVRVTFTDLPEGMEALEGLTMWVNHPTDISELPGVSDATPPVFRGAQLTCEPAYRDWSLDGAVHVCGEEFVSGATYDIQEVEVACANPLLKETSFSDSYAVIMQQWGDVVEPFAVPGSSQPDFVDITAVVDKFKNGPNAPIKAVVDLVPEIPNRIIDFNDIVAGIDAFRGAGYPYDGPTGCP